MTNIRKVRCTAFVLVDDILDLVNEEEKRLYRCDCEECRTKFAGVKLVRDALNKVLRADIDESVHNSITVYHLQPGSDAEFWSPRYDESLHIPHTKEPEDIPF